MSDPIKESEININDTSGANKRPSKSALPNPSGMQRATSIADLAQKKVPSQLHTRPSVKNIPHPTYTLNVGKWSFESSRDWTGWGKILGFYVIYYGILIFMCYASVLSESWGFWPTKMTPLKNAKTQARLQSPGLDIYPLGLTGNDHKVTAELGHEVNLKTSDNLEANMKWYENKMTAFADNFKNVTNANNNNATWIKTQCGNDFGYNSNTPEPCVIFSLNKIINWKLVGLSSSVTAGDGSVYDGIATPDHVHFHCDMWDIGESNQIAYDQKSTAIEYEWVNENGESAAAGRIHENEISFKGLANGKNDQFVSKHYQSIGSKEAGYSAPKRFDKSFVVMKIKKIANTGAVNFKCNAFADNIHNSYLEDDNGNKRYIWRPQPGSSTVINYANPVLGEFSIRW